YRGELIAGDEDAMKPLDEKEKRGLKFAGLFALVGIILIGALVVPANGILRNPETGEILSSPFMNSIVVSIAFVFLLA
ncbi:AbgT family transporter, partial [Clostridium perfringens]